MKKVNLLPWRAQVRSTQKKQFWYVMTSVFAVALAIDMFTHIIFAQRLDNQVQQNTILQQELTALALKTPPLEKINSFRQLQTNRLAITHWLNELTQIVPDGVLLTSIKREGTQLTLTGHAESATQISLLMHRVEASKKLRHPTLNDMNDHDFSLQLKLHESE